MPFLTLRVGGVTVSRREITAEAVMGRSSDCNLCVADASVSRRHCVFAPTPDGGWVVRDLGSLNGLFLRGAKVAEAELSDGDEVRVGAVVVRFMTHLTADEDTSLRTQAGLSASVDDPAARAPTPPEVEALTPRARQIFDLLLTGLSRKEIAAKLGLAPSTTYGYVRDLYRDLDVTSRPAFMAKYGRGNSGAGSDGSAGTPTLDDD